MKSAVKDEAVVYFVELFNSWGRVILVFGMYGGKLWTRWSVELCVVVVGERWNSHANS